jgi:predicted  nucleic acid-binding Zn-ribbon protein
MGWGSSGTPPWVDAKEIDAEKLKQKSAKDAAKIRALKEENKKLRERISQLENELKNLRK